MLDEASRCSLSILLLMSLSETLLFPQLFTRQLFLAVVKRDFTDPYTFFILSLPLKKCSNSALFSDRKMRK